jgi:hypothetical protein
MGFREQMRKHRRSKGLIDTTLIKPGERAVLLSHKLPLQNHTFCDITNYNSDVHNAVVDTGASASVVNSFDLIVEGSLRRLSDPIPLVGIAGGHQVEYVGKIEMETVDKQGKIVPLQQTVMINEELPCILISPQSLLNESAKSVDDHFSVYADRTEWHIDGQHRVNIAYDSSFLPRIPLFRKGKAEPTVKTFFTLFHPSNRNLSPWAKTWLKWHHKLGHCSFSLVRSLGQRGYLDKTALTLGDVKDDEAPPCQACKMGRQTRRPDGTTTVTKKPE